ncbi:alkene reductase [Microbulbifer sp. GL-2]|uniref:alkene reductase n=1 Tax=Microbulbifer sp. GL-2 TaxID=2591606 RepID=UPI0011620DB7|nr:alkene reductase [Microbulbifer sp. GL-2]BBM01813.1 alkene reductase [Microbulbifer sp. GL-2]
MTKNLSKLSLFSQGNLGPLETENRVIMAALTRARVGRDGVPTDVNAKYYAQRASAAMIISEATAISAQGLGWVDTPGIFTEEQIEGWQKVTDAVHRRGGKIFIQLWHMGREVHPDLFDGQVPVAPSPIAAEGEAHTYEGKKPYAVPRALTYDEIQGIIADYKQAAKNALKAGFDGVELHAAGPYLPAQFLHDSSNHRTDAYGGSVENRSRFIFEVISALSEVWGSNRIGIKLSPEISLADSHAQETYLYVVNQLNRYNLAYLQMMERAWDRDEQPAIDHIQLRNTYKGHYVANGMYDLDSANKAIANGSADYISFGRLFISNPDLVERLANNGPYNTEDMSSFFAGDEQGYVDYSPLAVNNV